VEQGLREHGDAAALEAPARALVERFAWRQGPRARAAANIYATLTLARHVWISTQLAGRGTSTDALLDLCERRLDLGVRSGDARGAYA
jgi:hypothetical protein